MWTLAHTNPSNPGQVRNLACGLSRWPAGEKDVDILDFPMNSAGTLMPAGVSYFDPSLCRQAARISKLGSILWKEFDRKIKGQNNGLPRMPRQFGKAQTHEISCHTNPKSKFIFFIRGTALPSVGIILIWLSANAALVCCGGRRCTQPVSAGFGLPGPSQFGKNRGLGRLSGWRTKMPYIILDEAQTRVVSQAKGDVEIRDHAGKHLGYVAHGFTDDDIRLARDRAASSGPRLTTAEVLDHLSKLEG